MKIAVDNKLSNFKVKIYLQKKMKRGGQMATFLQLNHLI